MFVIKKIAFLALPLLLVAGCKQELPAKLEQPNAFGTVQELHTTSNEKQLIYALGQDPYKQNWGLAGGYYMRVDGQDYAVHWDDAEKYKALKVGDKVNLHPSEFIMCVGEADLKPVCRRLMRVYKSERRINPVTPVQ